MTNPTPQQQMEARAREYFKEHHAFVLGDDRPNCATVRLSDAIAFALREIEALQKDSKRLQFLFDSGIVARRGKLLNREAIDAEMQAALPSPPEEK